MNEMERAENGASLLALSIDVNENEQKSTSYSSFTVCKSGKPALLLNENKRPAFSEDTNSVLSGKGYVYIASERNLNDDKAALGDNNRLDCVSDSECLPRGVKDSCVITERCSDGTVNGFTESSEQLVDGSEATGVGCKRTPSCSSNCTADKQVKKRNGMLIDAAPDSGRECGRKDDGVSEKQDNGLLNAEIGAKSVVPLSGSCDGKHQPNCTGWVDPADMKLTNGDVDGVQGDICPSCTEDVTFGCGSSVYKPPGALFEKEVKLASGGLLIVNKCALLNGKLKLHSNPAKCIGETAAVSDVQINKLLEPALEDGFNKGFCPEDDDFGTTGVAPSETTVVSECCDPFPKITTTVSGALDIENMGPKDETLVPNESSVKEDDVSEESNLSPLELRTNQNTRLSRSCEATPDSPGDSEVSFGTEAVLDTNDLRFMDVNLSSRNTFEVNRRQSAPDHLPDGLTLAADPSSHQEVKPKKLGITDFFSRSLFSRKMKDPKPPSQSAPGWKLFGKVPLRENPQKDSMTIQQDSNPGSLASVSTPNLLSTVEYEARTGKTVNLPPQSGRRKNLEFEPLSTTALILEDRPANLPAKSAEEALRHRHEYDTMVAEAKKREMKDAHKKKKIMKDRYKQEEVIANAMVIWNSEILPNWEAMRNTRKVRELWWQGLPPSVRGKVWSLAVGNELNITHELYEIFLSRAKERWKSFSETGSENEAEDSGTSGADRESSLDLIKLDISRTFPSLFIFQKGGPYHDLLHSVLGAYTCYRPDVGYVQGMSFIAAVLILNLEEADAFILFANLLNKPCQMAFFRVDHDLMLKYFAAFEVFFEENLPRLFVHFKTYNLTPDIYLIDWIFTLYSKSLPLDLACRVWDVFCRDGEEFLFRTGLGILKLYEDILLQMDFIHIAQFLTKLPEDITSEKLFNCIAAVQMLSSNKKWTQVFTILMKDNKEGDKNHSPTLKN
ncbi:TBC1 domain family member 12-like isoform X1 [Acipenser ruthenus]|uniref:TBC1 domain family member 12-like isoform X1 n=1 Tax=Acipenser ruthenus TaxID=7906 RepID=UPI0027417F6A|nr:TBC1 domain family member 12-like isoform X1 [Acipenser ruthenus]